jgi:hypothetical protein
VGGEGLLKAAQEDSLARTSIYCPSTILTTANLHEEVIPKEPSVLCIRGYICWSHLLCANMTGRGVGLRKEWRRGPDGCFAKTFFAQNYNILGLIGPKTLLAKSKMLSL